MCAKQSPGEPPAELYNSHMAAIKKCASRHGENVLHTFQVRGCLPLGHSVSVAVRERLDLSFFFFFRKPQRQTGRDSDSDSVDVTAPECVLKAEHKRLLLALKVTCNLFRQALDILLNHSSAERD